jgi:hypothetical protein
MGHWLQANGFDEISAQERYRAILCVENREAIEAWRVGLDDAQRRRLNHPAANWHAWCRAKKAKESASAADVPPQRKHIVRSDEPHKGGAQAVYWDQASVKRAAMAMIEARSQDWYVLARLALQAAVRTRDDVATLLDDPPARSPAKPGPVEAMALA